MRLDRRKLSRLAADLEGYGITKNILRNAARRDGRGDPQFPSPVGGSGAKGYLYEFSAVKEWAKNRSVAVRWKRKDDLASLRARVGASKQPGIYFIRCGNFIKIGHTEAVSNRLSQIRMATPYDVELMGIIQTPLRRDRLKIESEWHQTWAQLHHRGEWFHKTDELVEAINQEMERKSHDQGAERDGVGEENATGA